MSQNPYFHLFPINNARTGYKPFALPVVYVERNRLTSNGFGIANSETLSLRYYIVNAPGPSKVAGPFNANLRVPDESLFEISLDSRDRSPYLINLRFLNFTNANGDPIDFSDAKEGDYFTYTLSSNNVESKVEYFPDAYYYDLSTISIDVEELQRPRRYLFVWEASFNERIQTGIGNFKCIKDNIVISQFPFEVAHPGEVLEAMFRGTPSFVFNYENFKFSQDSTLEFYRPFSDILQDVYDEQSLLEGVNYIDSIPAEFIPYLAYLIGWDLPNFPSASDKLRRTILKNAVKLQKIKGTKRVIVELFDIFGYAIDLINLYANKDGTKLLAPLDGLDVVKHCQVDLIASDIDSDGFTIGVVPLTFRPNRDSDVTLYAWLVNDGVTKDALLENNVKLSGNLNEFNDPICNIDADNRIIPVKLLQAIPNNDSTVVGSSVVVIDKSSASYKTPILNHLNINYDSIRNQVTVNFDHEMSIHGSSKIFIYAVYERNEVVIPAELSNTRSNKFDVEIINRIDDEVQDFNLLQFLLNFLFKLKAFHSLLRKIKITTGVIDVYNVNDFCINGADEFALGSDLGDLQTNPPVTINNDEECENTESQFKKSDITLKNAILNGLEEEFQAWKQLNPDCSRTQFGQDRVLFDPNLDFDHNLDTRPTYCEIDESAKPNYCYKGRVKGELEQNTVINIFDIVQNKPCGLSLGFGFYWEVSPLNFKSNTQTSGSLKRKTDKRLTDKLLNFSNRPFLTRIDENQNLTLALDPSSLNIDKDNLAFPRHKFISINKLNIDHISSYKARPWDFDFVCGFDYNELNAIIVQDVCTVENDFDIPCEDLVYDVADLIYRSNGLQPDVSSLDPAATGLIITHKLFVTTSQPHPSLTDDFTVTSETSISTDDTSIFGAIYKSACNGVDYISGYPSEYGITDVQKNYLFVSGDTDSELDLAAIADGIGLVEDPLKSEFEIYLNSMIFIEDTNEYIYRYHVPYRLDCDCLYVECNPTSGGTCNTEHLYDDNGNFDFESDKLSVDIVATMQSVFNTCGIKLDGDIKSLLCINNDCIIPANGDIKYKDTYGIIYESAWVISENVLDITIVTKDPRIPGIEPSGYKDEDGNIFRKGIITQYRKIFRYDGTQYVLESQSSTEQIIGYFKDSLSCGETKYNVLSQNLDCGISENVELVITNGPRWIDPNDFPESTTGTGMAMVNVDDCVSTGVFWADITSCGNPVVDSPFMLYWVDLNSADEPNACDTGITDC